MSDRFFCSDLTGPKAVLEEAEAHHAIHVMRVRAGQQLHLFDGCGTTAVAVVLDIKRRETVLKVESRAFHPRPRTGLLTVAAAPPKGDRLKWMIEKLTEVGVDRYIPLISERTIVNPGHKKIHRLTTTVIAATKQSGRRWLMEIERPVEFSQLLQQQADGSESLLLAHPGGESGVVAATAGNRTLLVGPEGGFTQDEVEMATAQGAQLISRAGPILRTETAALVFAALVSSESAECENG